ncbi:MAG: alpha/beta hydrolase [Bacteroidota bacterium]
MMNVKKRYLIPLLLVLGLCLGFALGPRPDYPSFDASIPSVDIPLTQLDAHIADQEAGLSLKADNHSRIIWADSIRQTDYCVVYLHGFSASPMEGDPLHREFAKRYGCNLYLPRLAGHGIQGTEVFKDLTPAELIASAKEALAIGKLLGKKIILMSCSTGSTLGNYLTANNPGLVHAHLQYSPNIDIADKASELLTLPWGEQIARMVVGDYNRFELPEGAEQYWSTQYRVEGLVCLKTLVEETMTEENIRKIELPVYVGYYYRDEEHKDNVVSVDAIRWFYETVSTPDDQKRIDTYPNVDTHVGINHFQSKDLDDVRQKTWRYAEEVLKLPVSTPVITD